MSSSSSSIFSGSSRYSSDFQTLIDRAVKIASLPISQLNDDRDALTAQSTAMASLETKFEAVNTALEAVGDALGSGAYGADVADQTIATASIGTGAMEGTYSISVLDLGSYSTAISGAASITDPGSSSLSTATSFSLHVGSSTYTVNPAENTLTSLVAAINASGAKVRATMVNVGGESSPDYRLSLEGTGLSADAIELYDGATSLTTGTTGSAARYTVNGVATEATSDSRRVSIAPGLTVQLLKTGSTSVTVTRQSSAMSDALTSFATAYNAAMAELDTHRGEAGGALSGQEIVLTLSQALHNLATWTSGGASVSSLSDIGITFDDSGVMSFSSMSFVAADWSDSASVTTFIESFQQTAADTLDSLTNSVSGHIQTTIDSLTEQIGNIDDRIADEQESVDQMQISLTERMATADALIAEMEQQYSYITQLFQSMQDSSDE